MQQFVASCVCCKWAATQVQHSSTTYRQRSAALHRQFQPRRLARRCSQARGPNHAKQARSRIHICATNEVDRDCEKEDSRKYKRTVFNFKNWAAHRSTKRYSRHLLTILGSRIVRGLLQPLLIVTAVSSIVAIYETLLESGFLALGAPSLSIEATAPFSLTSFALSLLLVFRTNTSYARWQEARSIWGGVTNRSRDIFRQALTFVPGNESELVDMFKRWSIAYSKTLMCHLREEGDVEAELEAVLQPEELALLLASKHRPNYVLQILSGLVESSCIVSPERFRMDQNITFFMDAQGSCERILKTPIPLSYTRHTSRFLVIWLGLMPLTLWKSCRWAMIPVSAIIAFLLLGIEEIGVQIEEPFGILPLENICETIETNLNEMAENNSGVSYLIGKVDQQSWHMRHEWEENRRRVEGSHGNDPDFLRSSQDGDTAALDNSFATPDLSGSDHR
ncbi:hypothetical protein WJX77_011203 [Trebouxia sp. C0004]